MTRLIPALLVCAASLTAQIPGNGTDLVPDLVPQAPAPLLTIIYPTPTPFTLPYVIDTDLTPMPLRVRIFIVERGASLRVRGSRPFHVVADDFITIDGTIDASGLDGDAGGEGGPGGGAGGRSGLAGGGLSPGAGSAMAGGGGGNGTPGQSASSGAAGGGTVVPMIFHTMRTPGSGGGGSAVATGGGGGGIVRLHAGRRVSVSGRIDVNGGNGGDAAGSATHGAGGGSGGTIEIVTARYFNQISGPCTTCLRTAVGGVGGPGSVSSGGAGGDGRVIIRAGGPFGLNDIVPFPTVHPFGATMTPTDPLVRIVVEPDAVEAAALAGSRAFLLFSGSRLPGSGLPLGVGGDLLIDPLDPLFDPSTSPLYLLLTGQGATLPMGAAGVVTTLDFSPLVAVFDSLGLEEFSLFTQALLIGPSGVCDASAPLTVDYLGG